MNETTDPEVSVILVVRSTCPKCKRNISIKNQLSEEQLRTGNTTQAASYHATAMKAQVTKELRERGWRSDICGRCADWVPEPKVDERDPLSYEPDHECG